MTNNPCYKTNSKITVKGLMLHSVGCAQPRAMAFVDSWNKTNFDRACVHAFIDATTGETFQTLPWNHRGWHAGGAANNTHIGIEMCEPPNIKYVPNSSKFTCSDPVAAKEFVVRTYNAAVELFGDLCMIHNLNPLADGVIISHSEGAKRGLASGHQDPEHLWSVLAPEYTMNKFRADVSNHISRKNAANHPTETPRPSVSEAVKPVTPVQTPPNIQNGSFMVQVAIPNLRIRTGAGTNYAPSGYTGVGAFTIVETRAGVGSDKGWGKLKSGAGWISLDFCKRI